MPPPPAPTNSGPPSTVLVVKLIVDGSVMSPEAPSSQRAGWPAVPAVIRTVFVPVPRAEELVTTSRPASIVTLPVNRFVPERVTDPPMPVLVRIPLVAAIGAAIVRA